MKICLFTENYYKGGLDTFLINLINNWPDSHDKIILVSNSTHSGLDNIINKTARLSKVIKYNRVFTSGIANGQGSSIFWGSWVTRGLFYLCYRILEYPFLFPWYVLTLIIFFHSHDFDRLMVVNGGYPASLLGRCAIIAWGLCNKKKMAVMNFHNSTNRPSWYCGFMENMIDKLVIRFSSAIVSVSNDCLASLKNRRSFIGCRKLVCIYNGIDDPVFTVDSGSKLVAIERWPRRYCLMLATYESRKGHGYLFKAFQHVVLNFPDVDLRVFGHGRTHEKKRIVDAVKELGLEGNVVLSDFTTQTASLLGGASVLVVPSQACESFGLTIIEAMAFGVPVVVTNVGGIPEVLGDSRAGYICSKNNPLEFAYAIKVILGNPEHALCLGKNGRIEFLNRFSSKVMAQKYASVIK